MTSAVPTKIVLKSTTRMSLNDRFSSIAPTVQSIRALMTTEHQVSVANQRLAQQLARRPGIHNPPSNMYLQQPRGGGGRRGNFSPPVPLLNLQQRLGKTNVKNRLSLPGSQPMRGRGRGRGRGGNFPLPADLGDNNQWMNAKMRGRGNFNPRGVPRGVGVPRGAGFVPRGAGFVPRGAGGIPRGAGGIPRGVGVPRGVGGPRGRGAFRGRGRGAFNRTYENVPYEENRRRHRRRRRRNAERYSEQNTLIPQGVNTRGNFRGRRPGGRRGRGTGRGNNSNVSVADLDNQLDAYMSKTRTHLDSELDAYMSEVSK